MALLSLLAASASQDPLHLTLALLTLLVLSLLLTRLLLSPLRSIPSPGALFPLTRLPALYASYTGTEATLYTNAFMRLSTPILRIGPTEVLIADGAALGPIYSLSGGMRKAACYANFDIAGWPSLFSALDREHRAARARVVVGMFSTRALRAGELRVRGVVRALVERLRAERGEALRTGGSVELLDASRALAVDVVSAYLFGVTYGGVQEDGGKLSASEFVNAFVGVGRFFFLPGWLFKVLDGLAARLFETQETRESMARVDAFLNRLVDDAGLEDDTYQARLLKAGFSREEVVAQCMDLVFAGTDSSGMNLSTFCWSMARYPSCYAKVKAEVDAASKADSNYEPEALPYLKACIKESLRLSMANPTRLPRVVPEGGWTYTSSDDFAYASKMPAKYQRSYHLPPGTLVSVQIHTMHHNPTVFRSPFEFRPERWLESSEDELVKMNRDFMPFSLGSRQCIARNLAGMELNMACAAIVESGVLDGASVVADRIEILEWFNSKVEGEKIEIQYLKS